MLFRSDALDAELAVDPDHHWVNHIRWRVNLWKLAEMTRDADKIGRKEASERLAFLRDESPGNYQFHPAKSNEPMGAHAKLFAVDDMRLVVTSDNTLSFGDDVMERGDAGELGTLIDHPTGSDQTSPLCVL